MALATIADIHDPFETRRRWQGKAALRTGIGRLLQLQYLKPKATRQVLGRSSPTPSVKPASLDKAEKRSSSRKIQLSRSRWSPTAEQERGNANPSCETPIRRVVGGVLSNEQNERPNLSTEPMPGK